MRLVYELKKGGHEQSSSWCIFWKFWPCGVNRQRRFLSINVKFRQITLIEIPLTMIDGQIFGQ